eukprot:7405418-Pyramimonas_sp.AAC.1
MGSGGEDKNPEHMGRYRESFYLCVLGPLQPSEPSEKARPFCPPSARDVRSMPPLLPPTLGARRSR